MLIYQQSFAQNEARSRSQRVTLRTTQTQEQQSPAGKTRIRIPHRGACDAVRENLRAFNRSQVSQTTQYFTPLFANLEGPRRRACFNIEGSCITPGYLHNYPNTTIARDSTQCIFGFGHGARANYNATNCLSPCSTIAADRNLYPTGTVIYIPNMVGKICPQTGQPIDGCFVVSDVGSAIRGRGRFDLFTGECVDYRLNTNTCQDPDNLNFTAQGDFFVVPRDHDLAAEVRRAMDTAIRSWQDPHSRQTSRSSEVIE